MSTFKVGQRLFYVPRYGGGRVGIIGEDVTIGKVGKKWLAIQGESFRVNIETLDAESHSGFCGACYLNEQHYLVIKQKQLMAEDITILFRELSYNEHKLDKIQLGELENIKRWLDRYK